MTNYVTIITNDETNEVERTLGPFENMDVAEDAGQAFIDHKAKVWDKFQHISYEVHRMSGYYAAREAETRAACPEYAANGTCIHSDHTK